MPKQVYATLLLAALAYAKPASPSVDVGSIQFTSTAPAIQSTPEAAALAQDTESQLATMMIDPACGMSNATVKDVISCKDWIGQKDQTPCVVPAQGAITMCQTGSAVIFGESVTGRQEQVPCKDVATGVQWIIDHCLRPDQTLAGRFFS